MTPATMTAPDRSLAQRLDALERANATRTARAKLKRDLKAQRVSLADTVLSPPPLIAGAHIFDLLLAVPKLGRVKANRILTQCRIAPSKTIGGLSQRQREDLVRWLA